MNCVLGKEPFYWCESPGNDCKQSRKDYINGLGSAATTHYECHLEINSDAVQCCAVDRAGAAAGPATCDLGRLFGLMPRTQRVRLAGGGWWGVEGRRVTGRGALRVSRSAPARHLPPVTALHVGTAGNWDLELFPFGSSFWHI